MRVFLDPPISQWRLAAHPGGGARELPSVAARFSASAAAIDPDKPVIATGHQAWHWHPGILAKYLAGAAVAKRTGAQLVHLFVDHDVYDPLRLELPIRDGDVLRVEAIQLAPVLSAVPPAAQRPAPRELVLAALDAAAKRWGRALVADLDPLRQAWAQPAEAESLAHQVAIVLDRLMAGLIGPLPLVSSMSLLETPSAASLIDSMLSDAPQCCRAYNEAVAAIPQAGVGPLAIERDRVELPLWAIEWSAPRRRVYADISDSAPLLTDESGAVVSPNASVGIRLAPRALLLTALLRSQFCQLFIHGKGGGVYDRATERWWRSWRGEELAPMAVASADLTLPIDVPVADAAALARARWKRHHLPHNVDRFAPPGALDSEVVSRKRELLQHMGDDRDRRRRRAVFLEIHRINEALAQARAADIDAAARQVAMAQVGLQNQREAARRDWCFALYPKESLSGLGDEIERLTTADPPSAPTAP